MEYKAVGEALTESAGANVTVTDNTAGPKVVEGRAIGTGEGIIG